MEADLRGAFGPRPFRVTRIDGEPAGEATWFVMLYQRAAVQVPKPDALVALRDTDGSDTLAADAERARRHIADTLRARMVVVFGLPHRDAEAWFVAGLDPDTPRMAAAARELSFHPGREPHRLTSQPNTARTDAKRVFRFLLGEGDGLARAPSKAAPNPEALAADTLGDLARLERAEDAGLAQFLRDLRDRVAPRVVRR